MKVAVKSSETKEGQEPTTEGTGEKSNGESEGEMKTPNGVETEKQEQEKGKEKEKEKEKGEARSLLDKKQLNGVGEQNGVVGMGDRWKKIYDNCILAMHRCTRIYEYCHRAFFAVSYFLFFFFLFLSFL